MFFGGIYYVIGVGVYYVFWRGLLCFFCVYYVIFIQNIKKFFLYYLYSFDFLKCLENFYKNIILKNL